MEAFTSCNKKILSNRKGDSRKKERNCGQRGFEK